MKIIYRAANITEAEIVKGMLLSYNIAAHVSGFYLQGGIGEMAPTDLANVHVSDDDYERAKELVFEYEGNIPEQNITSHKVEHVKPTQNVFVTLIVIVTISALAYWVGI